MPRIQRGLGYGVINSLKIVLTWFDRLTMTGHPELVEGSLDYYGTVNIYLVINRGNGRQEVFHKDEDYEAFVKLMKEAKEKYPIKLFGYCLMPNHFHMAVRPDKGEDLSKWKQWLMTSHVRVSSALPQQRSCMAGQV